MSEVLLPTPGMRYTLRRLPRFSLCAASAKASHSISLFVFRYQQTEMPQKYYKIILTDDVEIHISFETLNGSLIRFVVKLVLKGDDSFFELVRFDSAHGCPHKDTLNPNGEVVRKVWLDLLSNKQALDLGIKDLKDNYSLYVERFNKWLKKEK